MSKTRRSFLQSAALTAGVAGAASPLALQGQGKKDPAAAIPDSEIKVPKVKFGRIELSRLLVGTNQFYGFAHYNQILHDVMTDYYTQEKVVEVLHRCEKHGINGFNYAHFGRAPKDLARYRAEGGKIHVIAQGMGADPTELVNTAKPLGVWAQGERVDDAYRDGKMDTIRDYCKKLRDMGVEMVGVGSHMPEVLAMVEEQDWDVDFYAGCVYNRRRTPEEFRTLLGGELPEMPNEIYLQNDPERMYSVFKKTSKPCVAFKILGAGRVRSPEQAFKFAYASIKPNDVVCVGMFPRFKDEVKENAYFATRHGSMA